MPTESFFSIICMAIDMYIAPCLSLCGPHKEPELSHWFLQTYETVLWRRLSSSPDGFHKGLQDLYLENYLEVEVSCMGHLIAAGLHFIALIDIQWFEL